MEWLTFLLVSALSFLVYVLYSRMTLRLEYWARRGVRTIQPSLVFGNTAEVVFRKTSAPEHLQKHYKEHKRIGYGGYYDFLQPSLIVANPELIKEMFVKNFNHFVDRRVLMTEKADPLIQRSVINLRGSEWFSMRHLLNPVFSSTNLRPMFPLIAQSCRQFASFLVHRDPHTTHIEALEFEETFSRLSSDLVTSLAFGLEQNACNNPNDRYYHLGKNLNYLNTISRWKVAGHMLVPKLMKFLNISMNTPGVSNVFRDIIMGTVACRERDGLTRPDLLQLLMEIKDKGKVESPSDTAMENNLRSFAVGEDIIASEARKQISDYKNPVAFNGEDLVSQTFMLFLAGLGPVATSLAFLAHELAEHQEIQERLREEIDAAILEKNGEITYEGVLQMKYLDMVVLEILRKYPPATSVERQCTKSYTVPGTDVVIEEGVVVVVPVFAIHRDHEYFPNPLRFDPERFSKENNNLKPYTYLPFGVGPRNCLGLQLAILEMKVAACFLLATCVLRSTAWTQTPIQLSRKVTATKLTCEAGFKLVCVPRDQPSIKLDPS